MIGYNYCWAEDVLTEMGYDYRDKKAVNWILCWMVRNWLEPERESVTSISDKCRQDFVTYIQKRNLKLGKT